MLTPELLNYILALIAIVSILFNVWAKIKNPQIKSEKEDALLTQKVQWTIESNERRFVEIHEEIKELIKNYQNDLHTIQGDLKQHIMDNTAANLATATNFTKIFTVFEERLPNNML